MKIRRDFVTNSSSSSYLCIAKVDLTDELRAYMKEEYGKFGLRLLDEQVVSGKEIREKNADDLLDYFEDYGLLSQLEDDEHYLGAWFIEWTNDGDTEDDDAFLYNVLPDKFKHEIFNQQSS